MRSDSLSGKHLLQQKHQRSTSKQFPELSILGYHYLCINKNPEMKCLNKRRYKQTVKLKRKKQQRNIRQKLQLEQNF